MPSASAMTATLTANAPSWCEAAIKGNRSRTADDGGRLE